MTGAEWIWYNGDFELYHSIKMHNRREEFDCPVPPFWALSAPYPNASLLRNLAGAPEAVAHPDAHHRDGAVFRQRFGDGGAEPADDIVLLRRHDRAGLGGGAPPMRWRRSPRSGGTGIWLGATANPPRKRRAEL